MSWEDFTNAVKVQDHLNLYLADHERNAPIVILIRDRTEFQAGTFHSLLTILYRHRACLATDPRDKIYGVSSLATDPIAQRVLSGVDYTIDKNVLFRQISADILSEGPDFSLLSVPTGLGLEHPVGLPSWAVDWSQARISPAVGLSNYDNIHLIRYSASKNSRPDPQFADDNTLLRLACCWVDTIEAVGTVLVVDDQHHGFSGQLRIPRVSSVLDNWREVARLARRKQYPTSESMTDAFIQTLTVGPSELSMNFLREQYSILDGLTAVGRGMTWMEKYVPEWLGRLLLPILTARYLRRTPGRTLDLNFRVHLSSTADRRIFRTEKGYIGMASIRAEPGDKIGVVRGGKVPLVFRSGESAWKLRGDCYLHGIMNGEAYDESRLESIWVA